MKSKAIDFVAFLMKRGMSYDDAIVHLQYVICDTARSLLIKGHYVEINEEFEITGVDNKISKKEFKRIATKYLKKLKV